MFHVIHDTTSPPHVQRAKGGTPLLHRSLRRGCPNSSSLTEIAGLPSGGPFIIRRNAFLQRFRVEIRSQLIHVSEHCRFVVARA